jgi:hypothetical protein
MSYPIEEKPARLMAISFTQDGARAGVAIMARLFTEGWESLEPLRYADCGHYYTTLYLPASLPIHVLPR